jgi:hypothetical protein
MILANVGRWVLLEDAHFRGRWRQADEIKRDPAEERPWGRRRRRLQSAFFELGEDETIDRRTRPEGLLHGGQGRADNRPERPMRGSIRRCRFRGDGREPKQTAENVGAHTSANGSVASPNLPGRRSILSSMER